jgi:hypothetical protein
VVGIVVLLLTAALWSGCGGSLTPVGGPGGSGGAATEGAGGIWGSGGGAQAQGTSYPCTGGFARTADGGLVPLPQGPPLVSCVVGNSYCSVEVYETSSGLEPAYSCEGLWDIVDGAVVAFGLGPCEQTPTCACLCSHGVTCTTNCSCQDNGGFVSVSCNATGADAATSD